MGGYASSRSCWEEKGPHILGVRQKAPPLGDWRRISKNRGQVLKEGSHKHEKSKEIANSSRVTGRGRT